MFGSKMPTVFGLVIMNTAIWSSSFASKSSMSTPPLVRVFTVTVSKPAIAALAGLVPWALSGARTLVRLLARDRGSRRPPPAAPSTRHGRRRPAAASTAGRPEISDRYCCISYSTCSIPWIVSSGWQRMQVGEARHRGDPLVPLGVVLHRATAERIEVRVDRHVERRQIRDSAE